MPREIGLKSPFEDEMKIVFTNCKFQESTLNINQKLEKYLCSQ